MADEVNLSQSSAEALARAIAREVAGNSNSRRSGRNSNNSGSSGNSGNSGNNNGQSSYSDFTNALIKAVEDSKSADASAQLTAIQDLQQAIVNASNDRDYELVEELSTAFSKMSGDFADSIHENLLSNSDLFDALTELTEQTNRIAQAQENDKTLNDRLKEGGKKKSEEYADEAERLNRAAKQSDKPFEKLSLSFKSTINSLKSSITDTLNNLGDSLGKAISEAEDQIDSLIDSNMTYRTQIMSRLQGIGGGEYDYGALLESINSGIGYSGQVKQTDVLKNIAEAAQKGIATNVEQRALLQTLSDTVVSSFDAFNESLLELVRIQRADTTAGRMGMEASLVSTFNNLYGDSSYMNSIDESVTSALTPAISQMSADAGAEFEYAVQKWLGALYEVGMDSGTISTLASAINSLATGDAAGLNSSGMDKLFAMAANNADLDYADLLKDGLDSSNVNTLLKEVVSYMGEIVSNSDENNVLKSTWAKTFGLSITDLKAAENLASTADQISTMSLTYGDMVSELNSQIGQINNRIGMANVVSNAISNVLSSVANTIAGSTTQYVMWEVSKTLEDATGGIHLPTVSILGNAIDLSAYTVEGLIRGGMVGLDLLTNTISLMSDATKGLGGSWLDFSGEPVVTSYGGTTTSNNVEREVSEATKVSSSSQKDIMTGAIADNTGDAIEVTSGVTESNKKGKDLNDLFSTLFEGATNVVGGVFKLVTAPLSLLGDAGNWLYNKIHGISDETEEEAESMQSIEVSSESLEKALASTPIPVALPVSGALAVKLDSLSEYLMNKETVIRVSIASFEQSAENTISSSVNTSSETVVNYFNSDYQAAQAQYIKSALINDSDSKSLYPCVSAARSLSNALSTGVHVKAENYGITPLKVKTSLV